MIFSGFEQMGEKPFKTVLFHGLVRDELGRKMSKSLGNGIDPLEVIKNYGADALRLTLVTGNAPGNDMRFSNSRVEASRNFANKVWNASRFIMMNMPEDGEIPAQMPAGLLPEDKWILSGFNNVVRDVTENMDRFELGIAVQKVHDFIWDEFCDWYIEMVKPRLYETEDQQSHMAALWTLQTVLQGSLKLLHPYMPFVTEEIFCTIQDKEPSIMVSDWPVWKQEFDFPAEEQAIETIKETVRAIRTARNERGVAPSRKAKVILVSEDEKIRQIFEEDRLFFERLASASELVLQADKEGIGEGTVSIVLPFATAFIPLADLLDVQAEIARLNKEKKRLEGELKRSAGMLRNEKFLSKAPADKIAAEKEKQLKYEQQMAGVIRELEELSAL
jgi:valyl-tRNA synthetase